MRNRTVDKEGIPLLALARVGPPASGPGNVGLVVACLSPY
jgi:hypothetical protein